MVKDPINPKITSLGEKLWPVACKQMYYCYIWKKTRENFEKQKFFLMSQGSFNPKNQVPRSKGVLCSLVTHRHESEYSGHPFRVSGIYPSTYHQGSIQQVNLRHLNTDLSSAWIHQHRRWKTPYILRPPRPGCRWSRSSPPGCSLCWTVVASRP